MQYIDNRVYTFDINYPLNTKVRRYWTHDTPDPQYLGESGFYFTPTKKNGDQITCFSCKKKETNIEGITNILDHHLINSPECPLSLIYSHKINYMACTDSEKTSYWEDQPLFKDPLSSEAIALRKETFGKFWKFDRYRLKSSLTSSKLAEAGFFFCPQNEEINDRVECVYCNITLQSWEISDDPITEHRNNSSGFCYFLSKCDDNYDPKIPTRDLNLSILSEKALDFLSADENEIIPNAKAKLAKASKNIEYSESSNSESEYESLSDNDPPLQNNILSDNGQLHPNNILSDKKVLSESPPKRISSNKLNTRRSTRKSKEEKTVILDNAIVVDELVDSETEKISNKYIVEAADEVNVKLENVGGSNPENQTELQPKTRKRPSKTKSTTNKGSTKRPRNAKTESNGGKNITHDASDAKNLTNEPSVPKLRRSRRLRTPSSNDNSFIFSLPKTKDELSIFKDSYSDDNDKFNGKSIADNKRHNESLQESIHASGSESESDNGKAEKNNSLINPIQPSIADGNNIEEDNAIKDEPSEENTYNSEGNVRSDDDNEIDDDEIDDDEIDDDEIDESIEEENSDNDVDESMDNPDESIYETTLAYSSQDLIEDSDASDFKPEPKKVKEKTKAVTKSKVKNKPKSLLDDDGIAFNPPKSGKIKLGFVKTRSPVTIMDISNQDIGDYGDNNLDFIERNVHRNQASPVKKFQAKKAKSKVFKIDTTDELESKSKSGDILPELKANGEENGTSPVKLAMPSDVSASTDVDIQLPKNQGQEKAEIASSPVSTEKYDEEIKKIMEINRQLEKSMQELSESEEEKQNSKHENKNIQTNEFNSNILGSLDEDFNPEAQGTFTSPIKSAVENDNMEDTGSNSPIIGSTRLEHDISKSKSITRSDEETDKSHMTNSVNTEEVKGVSTSNDEIIQDIKNIGVSSDQIERVQEKLNAMEQTKKYLERISSLEYSLKDDIEGELTQFISAMPEDEEELTIKQWIEHCGHNCSKLVKEICEDLITSFKEESQKGLKYLQSLPTSD